MTTTPPKQRGQAWIQREEDRSAVYNPETGMLHVLNPSALAIWELCDGQTTPEEMADAIAEISGLDPAASLDDVHKTLDDLRAAGLVEQT